MSIYDRQIAQAKRVIKKKGELVVWIPQDVTTDSTKPWKTTQVVDPPTFPVSIVFIPAGSSIMDSLVHLLNGTSVPEGGPRGLMAIVPFTPTINDTVLRGSTEKLIVKSIEIIEPNGDPILYDIRFAA